MNMVTIRPTYRLYKRPDKYQCSTVFVRMLVLALSLGTTVCPKVQPHRTTAGCRLLVLLCVYLRKKR